MSNAAPPILGQRRLIASHSDETDIPTVATILPRLVGTNVPLVQNLERVPPRYVDHARTALKALSAKFN